MIEINSHSIRSRFITCITEIPFKIYKFGGNGALTARLYIFVECAYFLQSLFQQNKTNVSFREIARLIPRNSSKRKSQKFLRMPSTKIPHKVPLRESNGPPELYIRNIFKRHFFLNHWSKFEIILQKCST